METKEKKVLNIRYRDSGVITLRNTGVIMFVAAGLCLLIGIFIPVFSGGEVTAIAVCLLASFFPLLFFGAACTGLSSIAKTALYQKSALESRYEFWDMEKKGAFPESEGENKSE
jgi:cadmium resistance protein CadD (predicted permease)